MPADNALVTPQVFSLPRAVDNRTQDKQQISQRGIPVTVTAVKGEGQITVKAEMVPNGPYTMPTMTIPGAYSQWGRPPIVVGDKGYVVAGDYYLGGQSGLGGGTAGFHYQSNLTNAVFVPVSNKSWSQRDMSSYLINGPNGVIISDPASSKAIIQIDIQNKKIIVYPKDSSYKIYLGGDGHTGSYAPLVTTAGPCLPNILGRYA